MTINIPTESSRIPEQEPDAFNYWAENKKDTKGTAAFYDIPYRTVRDWVHRYKWHERYAALRRAVSEEAVVEARTELRLSLGTIPHFLTQIIENPDEKTVDRLAAAKLLWMMSTGETEESKAARPLTLIDARQVIASAEESKDLRSVAARAIEANVKSHRR